MAFFVVCTGSTVHGLIEYVHDWAGLFAECIYDAVEGINSAREFLIREREDGGVCPSLECSASYPSVYVCALEYCVRVHVCLWCSQVSHFGTSQTAHMCTSIQP